MLAAPIKLHFTTLITKQCKQLQIVILLMYLRNVSQTLMCLNTVTSNNAEEKQQFYNKWRLIDSTKVRMICQG
jgi:hypothetical protein